LITFYTGSGLFCFVGNNFWMQSSMSAKKEKGVQAARDIAGQSMSIWFSKLDKLNHLS
jgi:hypothetical protein